MGQARIQRHQPDLLEDEAGEGRIFERHGELGLDGRADRCCEFIVGERSSEARPKRSGCVTVLMLHGGFVK